MNIIYTIAYSDSTQRGVRVLSKLLSSSLLRGFWSGKIIVFRNFSQPLFPVARVGLEEVFIQTPDFFSGYNDGKSCLNMALEARFRAVSWIEDPEQYEWIIYLDADCLALRDIEHLFAGDADILVQPERGRSLLRSSVFNGYLRPGNPIDQAVQSEGEVEKSSHDLTRQPRNAWLGKDGINAGTFAVRGCKYAEVMNDWIRIYESEPIQHSEFRDQTAFNKLLLETELRVKPFERGEIMFPFHLDKGFLDYREAALLHFVGGKQKDKIDLSFALHMMRVYGDEGGLFLDILES